MHAEHARRGIDASGTRAHSPRREQALLPQRPTWLFLRGGREQGVVWSGNLWRWCGEPCWASATWRNPSSCTETCWVTTMWSWMKRPFIRIRAPSKRRPNLSRVVLKRTQPTQGAFSELLGGGEIRIVLSLDRAPRNLFEGRFWGDLGFIHLCWDIRDMKALGQELEAAGFPFTVDSSSSFDMGRRAANSPTSKIPTARGLNLCGNTQDSHREKAELVLTPANEPQGKACPRMLKMLRVQPSEGTDCVVDEVGTTALLSRTNPHRLRLLSQA